LEPEPAETHDGRHSARSDHFRPPTRSTAIAPAVDHGLEIVPDTAITSLRELASFAEVWLGDNDRDGHDRAA
jgi:hypothetical protein